jgi:CubicO group peptidase (beta-lactamase class C family)
MRTAICTLLLAWPASLAGQEAPAGAPVQATDSLAVRRVIGPVGARLQNLLRRFESYGFSGAVLVALDGVVVLADGYGLADRGHDVQNTPATLFEMNSITKTFTGAAILQLEEQGRLHTADSAARYLGPFPTLKAGVTIDHLARHTAGLVVPGFPLDGSSRDGFVEAVKEAPIESRPGNRYRYTNAGYSMLAAIIERVSGETYDDYVRENLFRRAGLVSATFRGVTSSSSPRLARGYTGSPGGAHASAPAPYDWGTIGAGGIVSTVGDMYRWIVAIEKGAIVSEESRRKLFAPRGTSREAYGWHVGTAPWGATFIDKGGASADFASHVLCYPDDHLVVIWASNDLRQHWGRTLNATIPAAALGRDTPLPPPVARARPELAPLVGAYDAETGAVYLRAGEGYIYARRNESVPDDVMFFPQTPTSYTAFDPAAMQAMTLRFERTTGGTLTAEFRRGNRVVKLQKRP